MTPTLADLRPLALDLSLVVGAAGLLLVDLFLPAVRKRWLGFAALGLLAGVLAVSFVIDVDGPAFAGAYVGSAWSLFWKRIALCAGALATLGAIDHVERCFPRRQAEFYLLLLLCIVGMMLLPGARDLITLIVSFELMGTPLAVLAAFAKNDDPRGEHRHAPEAGLKLYLVTAVSTAITLFGLSLVYGMAATVQLSEIAAAPLSPLLSLGMLLTLAGMAFKIGAVPFHMWIPDTYQAAPIPLVAFLSVGPKATGFAALAALLIGAYHQNDALIAHVLIALIAVSITVGNLLALPQSDVKRLLAYSGIAQVGYMAIGLACGDAYGLGMLLFYVAGYLVANMGAFLVLEAVAPRRFGVDVSDLDGLTRRSPWLGLALLLFLLSLAGIPFAVGFWAKLLVFMAAYRAGHVWLVLFGAAMAIVGLFYYLRVARAAFMNPPPAGLTAAVRVPPTLATAIVLCMVAVAGMGLYPAPFVERATAAADAFFAQKEARAAQRPGERVLPELALRVGEDRP
jgi:NADH-quinone oxidoreductase subunit N